MAAVAVFGIAAFCPAARAETRAVTFPTALEPNTLNNVAVSRTSPVAFIASRDTDTIFAFDPRDGSYIGQVESPDGPLYIEVLERQGTRTLAVSCDGFLGATSNVVTFIDATDPRAMSVVRSAALPEMHVFFLGYRTLRFIDDGAVLLVTATHEETAVAQLVAFDVSTGAEIGRVEVGFAPGSLDIGFDGTRRIVAISQSVAPRGRVTIVDATSVSAMRVTRTIKFPRKSGLYNVNNVDLSDDGRFGVIATGDGNVFFTFDPDSGQVLAKTVTGAFPTYSRLFASADGPRLLVTGENASAVYIYRMDDPSAPGLVGVYDAPSVFIDVEPAITSDGATAFAGTTDGNKLYAVNLSTGALRYQVATGKRPISTAIWEGNGERYVCSSAANSSDVTTFRDTDGGFVGFRFAGPADAALFSLYQNIVMDRAGTTAFVASQRTNELLAIDVATATVMDRIAVGPKPSQIALAETSDGRRTLLALCFGDATLAAVDVTDPSDLRLDRQSTIETPYPFFLEFANVTVTSDGRTAFVADGSQFVYAIDVATGATLGSVGTGFIPVTTSLFEDRGQKRLAVLNASSDSTSVAVLDVSSPSAMSIVSTTPLPRNLFVALNNVPRFSADGNYVYVGASLSEVLFTIRVSTGTIAGTLEKTSAVVPAPFAIGAAQQFAVANLGTEPTMTYRLKKSGVPKAASSVDALENGFVLVGNDPVVSSDGSEGYVPNYGRSSLISFDPATGALRGELALGKGPGQIAIDRASGAVVAIEVNGTASRILVGNLADLGSVRSPASSNGRTVSRLRRGSNGAVSADQAIRERAAPPVAVTCSPCFRWMPWLLRSKSK